MIDYSKIKDVAIVVADTRESRKAQEILFSLGCKWYGGSRGVQFENSPVLYVFTGGSELGVVYQGRLNSLGVWLKSDPQEKLILAFNDDLAENLLKLGAMKSLSKPSCEGKVVEVDGIKYRLKKID